MTYGYSAKTNSFYVIEDEKKYKEFHNWPSDVKEIKDKDWDKYRAQGPSGKMRGADKNGGPCWINIPPPTKQESVNSAKLKQDNLLQQVKNKITPLQDAVDLNIATDDEKKQLTVWKTYRVLLSRIDINTAPEIDWPQVPSDVV